MKNDIVNYEKIARLLKLDEREKEIDSLLVESCNEWLRLICDRGIIAQEYKEEVLCENGMLVLHEWPIQDVINIDDASGTPIATRYSTVKSDTKHTVTIDTSFNGQVLTITYRAGYEENELPAIFTEACIHLFLHKKRGIELEMQGRTNEDTYSETEETYTEVMKMIAPYTRKHV